MSRPDDGHGPSYGCTFQACGNPRAAVPCPFVMDQRLDVDRLKELAAKIRARECKHEWRQLILTRDGSSLTDVSHFYCIHCLERHE